MKHIKIDKDASKVLDIMMRMHYERLAKHYGVKIKTRKQMDDFVFTLALKNILSGKKFD